MPRLLINREQVGDFEPESRPDALYLGNCDDGARKLAELMGWQEDLEAMIAAGPPGAKKTADEKANPLLQSENCIRMRL